MINGMTTKLCYFFFNDTATTEIYTLPLHDALPISKTIEPKWQKAWEEAGTFRASREGNKPKYYVLEMFPYPSGRIHIGRSEEHTSELQSRPHNSYAVFCLK